ncbi:MAG: FAD-dependent monooxygenase, partial [Chloroflexi bacterium]|nr:FAD-dependent monooxygenase [Chloroflexota bacterium]
MKKVEAKFHEEVQIGESCYGNEQDAFNLGWKLALAMKGQASPRLL